MKGLGLSPHLDFRCTVRRRGATVGDRNMALQRCAGQSGFAMVSVFVLLMMALTLGAATMLYTMLDLKSAQHTTTGNQAFAAAEAGVLDAFNNIQTRNVIDFTRDVITPGLISATPTPLAGYPNVTYQMSVTSGTNPATDGIITVTGKAPLTAERVITVTVKRGPLDGGTGALHLSNDSAIGTFSGNSMIIDGNNWVVNSLADDSLNYVDNSVCTPSGTCPRPAISTRNDTVTTQVVTALAGQGTITGLGTAPSVYTTAAGSTADLGRFVDDILANNGAPNGCDGSNGNNDYWRPGPCNSGPPGPQCGVHCVPQTKGNQGNHTTPDFWGTLAVPNITYVGDPTARLAGGSSGAGILIFAGDVDFQGNFSFCGWVLFKNPSANGIKVGGNPEIYGEVLSPLPAFAAGGGITIRYSQNCLQLADTAGTNINGNLPHPLAITSWSEP
jgi:hypothetical protein